MARQFVASGLIIFTLIFLWLNHEPLDKKEIKLIGKTMGTSYSIVLHQSTAEVAKAIKQNADRLLVSVNQQMSTYIKDSDISLFNQSNSTDWVTIPSEMGTVMAKALEIGKLTNGAYDITIGPLVNLYGFGPTEETPLPSDQKIQETLQNIGMNKIHLNESLEQLKKEKPDLYVDLSSIAKGYGVDALHQMLIAAGIEEFMVEIGGEVRTQTLPNSEKQWRIAIEKPSLVLGQIEKVVRLNNLAMATSGDYRNFRKVESEIVSHIIDPRNGLPVNHKLMSATVIADSCMEADGWATAMLVLGEEKGMQLANKLGLKAFFLVRDSSDQGYKPISSKAFIDFLDTSGKIKS